MILTDSTLRYLVVRFQKSPRGYVRMYTRNSIERMASELTSRRLSFKLVFEGGSVARFERL